MGGGLALPRNYATLAPCGNHFITKLQKSYFSFHLKSHHGCGKLPNILNKYTGFKCSSTVSTIQHDQAMLWRHSFKGNHLCQQPFGDCLTATIGLAKNRGLGGAYLVFGPICPSPLPMLSPSLNSHWTKRTRVA